MGQGFDVAAGFYPVLAEGGEAFADVDVDVGVGEGAGGVVYGDGCVGEYFSVDFGGGLLDLAHGYADVGLGALDVDFFRVRVGIACDAVVLSFGEGFHVLGCGGHVYISSHRMRDPGCLV